MPPGTTPPQVGGVSAQPQPVSQSAAAAGGKPFAPSSMHGWSNLRWTANHALPGMVRDVQRLARATIASQSAFSKVR